MYVPGYLIIAVANILDIVLWGFMWIVIIRAVLSWVNPDPYNPIVRFIYNITEPVLYQIRTRLPIGFGGIDLSPLIIILVIYFLQHFLVQSMIHFGKTLLMR
ncbi:MAG: YggT family protein [Desulfobacterales bacterium]|nr:YggT family protein [Desulfobacterales bacterium]